MIKFEYISTTAKIHLHNFENIPNHLQILQNANITKSPALRLAKRLASQRRITPLDIYNSSIFQSPKVTDSRKYKIRRPLYIFRTGGGVGRRPPIPGHFSSAASPPRRFLQLAHISAGEKAPSAILSLSYTMHSRLFFFARFVEKAHGRKGPLLTSLSRGMRVPTDATRCGRHRLTQQHRGAGFIIVMPLKAERKVVIFVFVCCVCIGFSARCGVWVRSPVHYLEWKFKERERNWLKGKCIYLRSRLEMLRSIIFCG